jgi:hypothetical protein
MHTQRTAPNQDPRHGRPRVIRRYRTCAEALQAASELEALAEDEISDLRERGLEAEADRRADAWNREIARALGEAEALRAATRADVPNSASSPRRPVWNRWLHRFRRRPALALGGVAAVLVALVGAAWLIESVTPELLGLAALALLLATFVRVAEPKRKGGDRGSR